jgi:predicted amidophosphoribosyltransferase
MSSFLNCQHCSHQIHESAPACPKCGAPTVKASAPTIKVNNTIVWILAFAPLIGLIIESIVAGVLAQNEYDAAQAMAANKYWFISLILNIGLSAGEDARLKQDGVDTSSFGKYFFLVPVFLWKRAKAFNQSPAYFWTWIGMFALATISNAFIGS